ncbi:MAG: hypothetical protein ACHQII_07905 [Bacteroidia bacterium]
MCQAIKECVKALLKWVTSRPLWAYVGLILVAMIAITVGIDHNWHSLASFFGNSHKETDTRSFLDLANFLYFITGLFTAVLAAIAYVNFKLFNTISGNSNLLQIDERWGSPEIIKARQIIHVLYRTACDNVNYEERNPRVSLAETVYPEIAKAVVQMSVSTHPIIRDKFIYLLNYLEFMESLGFLYKDADAKKIAELEAFCGHTLVFNYGVFFSYIEYKNTKHNKKGYFNEFKNLVKSIKQEKTNIAEIENSQSYYEPIICYHDKTIELTNCELLKALIAE